MRRRQSWASSFSAVRLSSPIRHLRCQQIASDISIDAANRELANGPDPNQNGRRRLSLRWSVEVAARTPYPSANPAIRSERNSVVSNIIRQDRRTSEAESSKILYTHSGGVKWNFGAGGAVQRQPKGNIVLQDSCESHLHPVRRVRCEEQI
jgi:hypothetical protein